MKKDFVFHKKYKNHPDVMKELDLTKRAVCVDTVMTEDYNFYSFLPYEDHYRIRFNIKTQKETICFVRENPSLMKKIERARQT